MSTVDKIEKRLDVLKPDYGPTITEIRLLIEKAICLAALQVVGEKEGE